MGRVEYRRFRVGSVREDCTEEGLEGWGVGREEEEPSEYKELEITGA